MGFSTGDVTIHKAMLTGQVGAVDITPHLRLISTFENVKKPYVAIQATMVDQVGVSRELNGNNWLQVSFSQPGQTPYNKTFALMATQQPNSSERAERQTVTLTGYSTHMTQFPKVQKAYRGIPLTDVAADLVRTFMQPLLVPLDIRAPSRGLCGDDQMPYNINGQQVHKAIRATLLRAVSILDVSSAYAFFEDATSLVIDTLENMQNRAQSTSYVGTSLDFVQRPLGSDFGADHALGNLVILGWRHDAGVDATATVQSASQQTRPYDVYSQEMQTSNTGSAAPSSYVNVPYNAMRPPTYLADVLAERRRIAAAFDQSAMTINVPLNTGLTVGSGFRVTLLESQSATSGNQRTTSMNLLATETRHTVDFTRTNLVGQTAVKGVRGDLSMYQL